MYHVKHMCLEPITLNTYDMPITCYENQNQTDPHVPISSHCSVDRPPKVLLHLHIDHVLPDQPSPCVAWSLTTLREGLYTHLCIDHLTHAICAQKLWSRVPHTYGVDHWVAHYPLDPYVTMMFPNMQPLVFWLVSHILPVLLVLCFHATYFTLSTIYMW